MKTIAVFFCLILSSAGLAAAIPAEQPTLETATLEKVKSEKIEPKTTREPANSTAVNQRESGPDGRLR